jgi:undecaprenyl-diphosphatase
LLASLIVSLLILAGLFLLVGHHRALGIDRQAFDVLAVSRGSVLARLAKPAAWLGPWFLAWLLLGVSVMLARHRSWLGLTVLLSGFALSFVTVHIAKIQDGRPRPLGPLLHATGYSFPSSDSTTCAVVIVCAIAVAGLITDRRLRLVLIALSCAITIGVGLLFIAVRVHYLTDVIAGWALAAAAYAACALVAQALSPYFARRSVVARSA